MEYDPRSLQYDASSSYMSPNTLNDEQACVVYFILCWNIPYKSVRDNFTLSSTLFSNFKTPILNRNQIMYHCHMFMRRSIQTSTIGMISYLAYESYLIRIYFIILHYTILYYTELYYTILNYTTPYYTILCCTALYYYTTLCCTILYYTILY